MLPGNDPLTDETYDTIGPTLLSLWSGMLGGALGGVAGKLSSNILCNGTVGFFAGAVSGVLVHMVLLVPVYVAATYLTQAEFSEYTIGRFESDVVSCVLGGIGGICAAVIVTLALPSYSLNEPHAFALCWSTAAVVPVLLLLGLVWFVRTIRS